MEPKINCDLVDLSQAIFMKKCLYQEHFRIRPMIVYFRLEVTTT